MELQNRIRLFFFIYESKKNTNILDLAKKC